MGKPKPVISAAYNSDLKFQMLLIGRSSETHQLALAIESEIAWSQPEFRREIRVTENLDAELAARLVKCGLHCVILVLNSSDPVSLTNVKNSLQFIDTFLLVRNTYIACVSRPASRSNATTAESIDNLRKLFGLTKMNVMLENETSRTDFSQQLVQTAFMRAGFTPGFLPNVMGNGMFSADTDYTTF